MNLAVKVNMPMCLPQFSHIRRYQTPAEKAEAVAKIMPGEYYVTPHNEMITTVLGSCISVCVYDIAAGCGGMNHFMLPANSSISDCDSRHVNQNTRYGNHAMELLVNDVLLNGGSRDSMRFKIFGGGDIMAGLSSVGSRNVEFIRSFVRNENYRVEAEDLGGSYPRQVNFYPMTGRVRMKRLPEGMVAEVVQQETKISTPVESNSGELELF